MILRNRLLGSVTALLAGVAAVILPSALAESVIWAACTADCRRFGWTALSFGPAIGYTLASVLVASLGMLSYQLLLPTIPKAHVRRAYGVFAGAGVVAIITIAVSPSFVHGFVPELAAYVAGRI